MNAASQGVERWSRTVLASGTALPLVATAVVGVQVGASVVGTRVIADRIDPFSLAFLRYAIGLCCLLPLILRARPSRFRPVDRLSIACCGVLQFGVLIVLLTIGLRSVPAGRGALIFATMPILAMAIAMLAGAERWGWWRGVGVLGAVCGLALALGPDAILARGAAFSGEVLIAGAAACGALSSVLAGPYVRRYGALPVCWLAMTASVVALAGTIVVTGRTDSLARLDPLVWLVVALLGAGSAGGYFLWLWALGHASASRVTVFQTLGPVTAILFDVTFLGQPVYWETVAGLVMVAVGIWLATAPAAGPLVWRAPALTVNRAIRGRQRRWVD